MFEAAHKRRTSARVFGVFVCHSLWGTGNGNNLRSLSFKRKLSSCGDSRMVTTDALKAEIQYQGYDVASSAAAPLSPVIYAYRRPDKIDKDDWISPIIPCAVFIRGGGESDNRQSTNNGFLPNIYFVEILVGFGKRKKQNMSNSWCAYNYNLGSACLCWRDSRRVEGRESTGWKRSSAAWLK